MLPVVAAALALAFPAVAPPTLPADPKTLWQRNLPARPTLGCSADATLVVVALSHLNGRRGEGAWFAVDPKTGATRWHHRTTGLTTGAPPVFAKDLVIVGHGSFGQVMALDRKTGKERWRLEGAQELYRHPTEDGDELWLAYNGGVTAVATATGVRRLTIELFAGNTVLGADDTQVYVHNAPAAAVIAFDKRTGEERWRLTGPLIDRERGVSATFQLDGVVLDATSLYVPTNVAETWAVDKKTGKKRWGFEPEGTGVFGVARGGTHLFLTSTAGGPRGDSFLQRVSMRDGILSWAKPLGAFTQQVPVVSDALPGLVLVGTGRGLQGFATETGEPRFSLHLQNPSGPPCVGPDGTVYLAHGTRLTALLVQPRKRAP